MAVAGLTHVPEAGNAQTGAPRAVLVSLHYWASKRRGSFHFIAEALWRAGWQVVFVTASLSWLSVLRRDYRLEYPVLREANRPRRVRERLWSYVWFTPFHPANLRHDLLNRLSTPLFRHYGDLPLGPLAGAVRDADLFLFESTPGLALVPRFKALRPDARFVYLVSDDLRYLRNHPLVLETEQRVAPLFDLISVPHRRMTSLFRGLDTVRVVQHGIRTDLFDADTANPYPPAGPDTREVVFVGIPPIDRDFLERAVRLFPTWRFHIIGPIVGLPRASNLIAYGERPFEETVPYIKHADIGLHIPTNIPGVDSRSESLKVIQYTYCRVPIVAPDYLHATQPHVLAYRPGDDAGIATALATAARYDRTSIERDGIHSWDDVARIVSTLGGGAPCTAV